MNITHYNDPSQYNGRNMISGICPFCNQSSGFKINGQKTGHTVPLKCDNCEKNVIWDFDERIVLPVAKPNSLIGLPENVDHYYQEALNCIAALAPNGAATLFRKLIHQVGIHYNVAKINDSMSLMGIVEKLESEGHINKKLVEALRRVKDLGNDGAHINENEPDMEQIYVVKNLIDSFLQATVLQDANIEKYDQSKEENKSKK
ncbi:MAG: hypothetical protein UR79_C0001G0232 [Candidatus Campbellbacteria bacterium GW2011_GWD1_35_49]|nr:MAG: Uncharacterized protein UR58_C0001G0272 [Candidatus Campbellbacteria bacterium GW2011_OD1_34_28]KKP75241.1 MAG: hypothetical protein UR74_C0001G0097 [Candidatus Campbellbacteria bacterium GW2011_GWD2_35_24]KKP76198.1 MAG: hypothetical protein UR75_C0001G0232 [Candidatus Campbellbacteria bacterium GW2011_GWC2_35_28]KKP77387.1 MAG: hypothetical protein UR76_C0001G0232 [Candidatus Campbellbacteria bacterium GW2011_GWC1_35_31]KKP79316.1 MAG: hypothetical protein UR79_C0001G0232 [Candidatus 